MKAASTDPVQAPVSEGLLEAGAAHLLQHTLGKRELLVESPDVPGRLVYNERHTTTQHGLPWKQAIRSKC